MFLHYLLEEAADLRVFPLVTSLDAAERIEEDYRRPSEEAFALTFVPRLRFD